MSKHVAYLCSYWTSQVEFYLYLLSLLQRWALSTWILLTSNFSRNISLTNSSVSSQDSSSYSGIPSTWRLSCRDLSTTFRTFSFNSLCSCYISSTCAMRSIFCCFIELSSSTNLLSLVSWYIWILCFNSSTSFTFFFSFSFIIMSASSLSCMSLVLLLTTSSLVLYINLWIFLLEAARMRWAGPARWVGSSSWGNVNLMFIWNALSHCKKFVASLENRYFVYVILSGDFQIFKMASRRLCQFHFTVYTIMNMITVFSFNLQLHGIFIISLVNQKRQQETS